MTNPEFISLFSGAGGLDIGLEQAGWRCAYASDLDPKSVQTLTANMGDRANPRPRGFLQQALVEQADVTRLSGHDVLARIGRRKGDIPLLAGGPPCQSWSSAGHQLGFSDPRGQLWSDFARVARQLDVRWLLFENVRGLLTARGVDGVPGSALATIRSKLLNYGFQTTVSLLNAADFGAPQRRVRLFVIGYQVGDKPPFPDATHTKNLDAPTDTALLPWVPLKTALLRADDLSADEIIRPTGKMAAELANVSAGSGVKSMGKTERTRPGGHWGYKQGAFVADPSLPGRTVTASSQQDWIRDPKLGLRRLCPRECAAIQTFPLGYEVTGKRSDKYRQIGNAVPPILAKALGVALKGHIDSVKGADQRRATDLLPLPEQLQSAIRYTIREEASNGASRKAAPVRRRMKKAAVG